MERNAQTIKNMILERDSIRVVMLNEMCASILSITELHLEALGKSPLLAHEMSLAILHTQGTALLQHLLSATLDEFMASYRTVDTIPDTTTVTAMNVRTRETIRLAFVSVLVTSWTIYLKQQLCLALRKKAKESLASNATTDAAVLLDAEVPATQEQLRDLITREATKIANQKCNALRNEITNLKKRLDPKSSKKAGRGPPRKQGTSQKKKNSGNKKSIRSKRPRRTTVWNRRSVRRRKRWMNLSLKSQQTPEKSSTPTTAAAS
jgi:hypothetical protein